MRNVSFPNPFISGPIGIRRRIGFIAFGVLWLVLFSFLLNFASSASKAMTEYTIGTVATSQVSHSTTANSVETCSITVSFTANGKTYSSPNATVTSNDCKYPVGSQVPIVYNPSNPTSYMPSADKTSYGVIYALDYGIGIASILLGVISIFLRFGRVYPVVGK